MPSLEDEWKTDEWKTKDEFNKAAAALLKGFLEEAAKDGKTWNDLSKISVRRSSNKFGADHDRTTTQRVKVRANGKDVTLEATFKVGGELHGPVPSDTDVAYSNDGNFVWCGAEDARSMKNPDDKTKWPLVDTKNVKGWKGITKDRTGPTLLWRPAYNCFAKKTLIPVLYNDSDSLTSRKDADPMQPMFDRTEMEAVKTFFSK